MTDTLSPRELLRSFGPAAELSHDLSPFALGGYPATSSLAELFESQPFLMAPMAGVSDAAYRLMARAGGAALAYTEMVSVAGIHYSGSKTWELALPAADEPDIAVQLFGRDPSQFEEAAAAVRERLGDKLALIDINMACPVPKVVRKGEGSALLDEPERAADIVRACLRAAGVPVTVKMRLGRRPDAIVAPDFARALEAAGAHALAVHGRSASQLYRGQADWDAIAQVVDAVDIPVIASGDVFTAQTACDILEHTGAAAAFIARGSYGTPWIFRHAQTLRSGHVPQAVSLDVRIAAFELHLRLLEATHAHMARARSLAGWYFKGIPHAADFRRDAMECSSLSDFLALVAQVRERLCRWETEHGSLNVG
ncbi:MAG: tRNA dihydrouridine synthase DusB [Atopobiaceae bacterium]|nr:tRNA dihydrouridine synthase DusB [Atopobiaceae bacterium]